MIDVDESDIWIVYPLGPNLCKDSWIVGWGISACDGNSSSFQNVPSTRAMSTFKLFNQSMIESCLCLPKVSSHLS